MPLVVPLLIFILAVAWIAWKVGWRKLGMAFASFGLGAVSYFFAGIGIARYLGVGRFYSVPFGGYTVRDADILTSVAVWIVAWYTVIFFTAKAFRPARSR